MPARYVRDGGVAVNLCPGGGPSTSPGPDGQLNYTGPTTGNANQAEAGRCHTLVDLVVDRIGLYIATSSGNLDLGVYEDNAGVPDALLASTGSFGSPGTGAQLRAISEITIPAGFYWLAMVASNTTLSCGYFATPSWYDPYDTDSLLGTTSRGRSLASAFPLPSPWSGGSATGFPRTMWVEHS